MLRIIKKTILSLFYQQCYIQRRNASRRHSEKVVANETPLVGRKHAGPPIYKGSQQIFIQSTHAKYFVMEFACFFSQ
jgi:hypothetical protein